MTNATKWTASLSRSGRTFAHIFFALVPGGVRIMSEAGSYSTDFTVTPDEAMECWRARVAEGVWSAS